MALFLKKCRTLRYFVRLCTLRVKKSAKKELAFAAQKKLERSQCRFAQTCIFGQGRTQYFKWRGYSGNAKGLSVPPV
ncbi:hypothetical protein COU78_04360 [Candidatus Peregrinibacteria bacterium CG10_big_fil_rev_8_21_14_0_10_49_24]|nr:MAG: hypothetical protein COU78_04360 [Candidatus Peregrinibacteria bacterium CG10_big_fil_rev_8_21_14_0_10_49_24]